jgi:Tfp pilus assembly protein PilP
MQVTRVLSIAVALALPLVAAAQTPSPAQGVSTASAVQGGSAAAEQPTALEPPGFDYNPDGRRDPFVSLVRRGVDAQRAPAGTRPAGLGGLETSEVSLKGTLQSRDGYVAMLQGADGRTYTVRPGDRLLDGTVRSISQNTMVILQQVNDPLSRDTQREVRKTIRQADEAK